MTDTDALTAKLLKMKQRVEEAKDETARAEGALESAKKRLADEFSCKSVAAAEKKRDKLVAEIDALTEEYENGIEKLDSDFNWND